MKKLLIMIMSVVHLCVLAVGSATGDEEQQKMVHRWLAVLKKGDALEKRLALNRLYLSSYEIIDDAVLEGLFGALKDKDADVRLAAVSCLMHFGESQKGFFSEIKQVPISLQGRLESKDALTRKSAKRRLELRDKIIPELIKALSDKEVCVRVEAAVAQFYYEDERSIAPLTKSLDDPDPWVRLNAVYTLGKLRAKNSITGFLKILSDDSDWRNKYVQQEAVLALSNMGIVLGTDARNARAEHMRTAPPPPERGQGLEIDPAIGATRMFVTDKDKERAKADDLSARNIISAFMKISSDPYVRRTILELFGRYIVQEGRDIVVKATTDPDEMIRKTAIESLARLDAAPPRPGDARFGIMSAPMIPARRPPGAGSPGSLSQAPAESAASAKEPASSKDDSFDTFKRSLSDPSTDIRAGAAKGLGNIRDPRGTDLLIAALKDPFASVRMNAAAGLGNIRDLKAVDPLIKALQDSDLAVKKTAIEALGRFSEDKILDVLTPYMKANTPQSGSGLVRVFPPRTLQESALNSFQAVAKNGKKGDVYVYRKNGERFVTKSKIEAFAQQNYSERIIHPYAVKILIDIFKDPDQRKYWWHVLDLLTEFEDPRIEKLMIALLKEELLNIQSQPDASVSSTPPPSSKNDRKGVRVLKAMPYEPLTGIIQRIPATCGSSVVPHLLEAAEKGSLSVRTEAIKTLGVYRINVH